MLIIFCVLCVTAVLLLKIFLSRKYNYWKKKNVPHQKPTLFLGDHYDYILMKKYVGKTAQEICKKFPNEPYIGTYYGWEPALLVQDPDIIKTILTKDFYYFNSREISAYTHKEVVTQNIFFTYGNRWKVLRQNLTPLFSSAKLKNMFHLIQKCNFLFEKLLDEETAMSSVLEVKALMARYTMDCIGSCAFGVETETLQKNVETNPFTKMGNYIFETSNVRGMKMIARAVWPKIFYGLGFKTFPPQIDQFFIGLLTNVFQSRQYKPSNRNDFVDLILELKKNNYITGDDIRNIKTGGHEKISLEVNDDFMVGQCVALFAAGFETSATTMSLTLFELAKNEEIQTRAIEEVDEYLRKHDNILEYDCVTELPYIEACIDETLRYYPVLGILTREVVEDYTLPSGLLLEKDMRIHIPLFHLHRNPKYFPEPEQYRPERFLGEEKRKVNQYIYMPFGEGPRICAGFRFAKMQIYAGLVTILKKYRLQLADDMPTNLEFEPRAFVTQARDKINIKFLKRPDSEQRMFKSK